MVDRAKRDLLGEDVGQRIRKRRLEKGMSLAELGGDDLSRSFLSLVELGKSRISLRALAIIADRLETPISYFLDDSEAAATLELAVDQATVALATHQPGAALRILDEIDVPDLQRGRVLTLRGQALLRLNRARESAETLRDALRAEDGSADIHTLAELRYSLGAALYSTGAFDEALLHLRKALDDLTNEPVDPSLVGRITVTIGHVLALRDDVEGAIDYYTRAREYFSSIQEFGSLGAIYSGLSVAHERRGDLATALRYSKLSIGAFEAQHNVYQVARELNNMAVSYGELDNSEKAIELASEAAHRAHVIGASDLEAAANGTLARIHFQLGDYKRAAAEAAVADELAPDDVYPARIGAWSVQAALAEREGNREKADVLYRRALETLRDTSQRAKYADVALEYSLVLRQRGDVEAALDLALEAAQAKASRGA